MEARKWEELQTDCLVNVLGRLELKSLLMDIPFVCKSWYKASLNPLCWKQLDFSFLYRGDKYGAEYVDFISRFESRYGFGDICRQKLVYGVIRRSAGCATYVRLPSFNGVELSYVADNCPALKTLVLHLIGFATMFERPCVIGRFKNMEMLCIEGYTGSNFEDIVCRICNGQNFTAMNLVSERYDNAFIGEDEVMAVVNCLPKLKAITLKWVWIEREHLIKLLNGCVDLVHLDVSDCYGFDGNDEQLLKLASHIPTFKSSGSVVYRSDYDDDEFRPITHGHLQINLLCTQPNPT